MPRYFLHVHNTTGSASDEEGAELAGLEAARERALEGIRSIVADEALHGLLDLRGQVDIADEAGRVIEVVAFSEAFETHVAGEPKT